MAGPDDNWDLHNYHLYGAFAWLEGRADLNAVGLQSSFNPLINVPYYLLAVRWLGEAPRLVGFLVGLPYGLLGWLVFQVARNLPGGGGARRAWLAAVIGMTGTVTVSEIGTTYGDIPVAILVIGALVLMLRGGQGLAAGVLLGLAGGLKLPACIFAPGLVLGVLATGGLRPAVLLCLGWAAGFAATYGAWGGGLWTQYGNPVFPLFNGLFGSAWGPLDSGREVRFLPRDWGQVLAYPFWWLTGKESVASETGVRDAHFALAWIAAMALLLTRPWRLHSATRLLLVFAVVSFAIWQGLFSILRYAVALEVLTGVVILAALHRFLPARQVTWGAFAALVLVLVTAGWPGWGRVRGAPERLFAIDAPALPAGTLVVTASKPVGFVLPFLRGEGLRFTGLVDLTPGTRMHTEVMRGIAAADRLSVLVFREEWSATTLLAAAGWRVEPAGCVPVTTGRRRWGSLVLCPAERR